MTTAATNFVKPCAEPRQNVGSADQSSGDGASRGGYDVQSVLRAAAILKAFRSTEEVVALHTLIDRVRLSKPTTFRLVETLVSSGLVERAGKHGYRTHVELVKTKRFRLGYAAKSNVIPFTSTVTDGLMSAASAANIDLLVLNNNFSPKTAVLNAERFVQEGVDLVIDSQIDFRVAAQVAARFSDAGIPFIAVDVPHPGAIYFGPDHYKAGRLAGQHLAKWASRNWNSQVDQIVLISADVAGPILNTRLTGMFDGIVDVLAMLRTGPIHRIDTKGQFEKTLDLVRKYLRRRDCGRMLIGAVNDTSALAALQAVREVGREDKCAVAGQDACKEARVEMRSAQSRLVCSVAYFPETYGSQLIKLAIDTLSQKPTPRAVFVNHKLVTKDNVDQLYPYDHWMGTS